MIRIIALLLVAGSCFGQLTIQSQQPFFRSGGPSLTQCQIALGTGFPTNISGYSAYGWWVSGCYATNAGVAVLTDYSLNNLDLTNATVGNSPTGRGNVWNGFADTWFGQGSGTHTLVNTFGSWIPSGNTAEFWCVMSYTNVGGLAWLFHNVTASNNGLAVEQHRFSADKLALVNVTNGADAINDCTNKYIVFNFVFASDSTSTIYTNNVAGIAVGATVGGPAGMLSFRLAGGPSANNPMNFSFLEGGWFRTNLTAAGRLALYQYCTNKYSLLP